MRLLRRGKVKDIYELDDGKNILFHFSDRISAFDIKMSTPIPRKGEVLCKFGEFWFNSLGTRHHMIKVVDKDKMLVEKLNMIPVECVVRGYFYGSLVERYRSGIDLDLPKEFSPVLATKLPKPVFDPTTKSEEHDRPTKAQELTSSKVLSKEEYEYLEETSISLYNRMAKVANGAGFIMADVKFEFGRNSAGEIVLGDSLGPDEYRLWLASDYVPGRVQESYDKQLLRDWLIKTGFKDRIDTFALEGRKPDAPVIPIELVNKLSQRYIAAYERITGSRL